MMKTFLIKAAYLRTKVGSFAAFSILKIRFDKRIFMISDSLNHIHNTQTFLIVVSAHHLKQANAC